MDNDMLREQMNSIMRPEQNNETKEMVEEMNADTNEGDGFSKIDMRTRLTGSEVPAIVAVDSMIAMGVFPTECSKITRSKKRLAVSLGGQGRKEMVDMIRANREQEQGKNIIDKMKGG